MKESQTKQQKDNIIRLTRELRKSGLTLREVSAELARLGAFNRTPK